MKLLVVWVAVAGLVACGGRYEEPGSGGSGTSAPSQSSTDADGGKSSSGTTVTLPQQDLGVCVPGFERAAEPSRSCNWVTEAGVCFDTKDAACNCVCPTTRDSECFSNFDGGPGSATLVYCS